MTSEKFCLRWNDFESNVSIAFRELREEKDFFDVTLACDDNQVQAHKVILSACSPFFRNILRKNPHQHPLLYLKGVKYTELLSVLNFMYQGEVNVAQEELNSFLAVAEELRVKGLTQNNQSKPEPSSRERPREPPERDPVPPPAKKPRQNPLLAPKPPTQPPVVQSYAPMPQSYVDDDIQEVAPVKSEPREPSAPGSQQSSYDSQQQGGTVALDDESYAEYGDGAGYDDGQYGEEAYDSNYYDATTGAAIGGDGNKGLPVLEGERAMKEQVEAYVTSCNPGSYSCTVCGYQAQQKQRLMYHVEAKHMDGPGYACDICNKSCRTKNALLIHKCRFHRNQEKPF